MRRICSTDIDDWSNPLDSHDPRAVEEIARNRLRHAIGSHRPSFLHFSPESACQIGETRKVRLVMIAGYFGPSLWIGAMIVYLVNRQFLQVLISNGNRLSACFKMNILCFLIF